MSEPPPLTYASYPGAAPYSRDADHLRILSILHYVWGGLILLFSCFAIVYIVLGGLMVSGAIPLGPARPGGPPPPPPQLGWTLVGMGSCGLVFGGALGIVSIVSGRRMMQRRSRVFSIVVASISCLSVPLGTTLGVFTIVVLMRDSVKAMYAATSDQG